MSSQAPAPPGHSAASGHSGASGRAFPVRAYHLLKVRTVWILPLLLGSVVVVLISVFYVGSVVDPLGHLHGLPVAVVNQDRGAMIGTQRLNIGQQVQRGLSDSTAVSGRLGLTDTPLGSAEQAMDRGASYATVVIPPGFTASLLSRAGVSASGPGAGRPQIVILTNQRAGVLAVSLAAGVLQPGLGAASGQIGRQLAAFVPAARASNALTRDFLAGPVTVTTAEYRPLPGHAALGLSAFYLALLILMCGFLGGTIVNSSVDAATGYATTEIGPRWRQRQPLPINRWQTLIIKWVMAVVLTGLMTGLLVVVAAGILRMDAPHPGLLWLLAWLCSASVAEGTIVLFAVLGASIGQLLALLLFVYAGLAASGGTVPVQALPGVLRWLAEIEPLRQILAGTQSILYFGAQADAGLTRAVTAAALGLVFWLILGAVLVRWYDRKGFNRLDPELLAYVSDSLYPKYKGGHPPKFTLPQRREIKKIAKSKPVEHDLPFSTWSLAKLADFLVAEGVVDDISHEGLRVLLRQEGVSFQRLKTWKASKDPQYAAKKARVEQLYAIADREITPADGDPAIVFCLDEFGPLNLQPPARAAVGRGERQGQGARPGAAAPDARHLYPHRRGPAPGLSRQRCFRRSWLVGLGGWESVGEGDREGVQGGLPPHGPPCPAGPGGVKGPGDQVEALERGLLGGEMPAGFDCPAVAGVERFDRVCGADDRADLQVVVQERDELGPGVLPQPDHGPVLFPPFLGQLVKRAPGRGRVHRRVNRLHVPLEGVPVPPGSQPERIADQVHDAGLHDRLRPGVGHHVGQPLQPVADQRTRPGCPGCAGRSARSSRTSRPPRQCRPTVPGRLCPRPG
jgi:YhgE/Pip-like protein